MRTDFYKRYKAGCSEKYPNMKTCFIIVVSNFRVVLQMCLQTVSSVLSSDGHLKPIRVDKFNLGSLHTIMNIVITL